MLLRLSRRLRPVLRLGALFALGIVALSLRAHADAPPGLRAVAGVQAPASPSASIVPPPGLAYR